MAGVESWSEVGTRVREARLVAGLTQDELAQRLGVDRSALVRMESGQRQISALELYRLSDTLGFPLAHFVSAPVPAIVSKRQDLLDEVPASTRERFVLDSALEAHSQDASFLRSLGYLPVGAVTDVGAIGSDDAARQLAESAREAMGIGVKPLPGLAEVAEIFGLYMLVVDVPGEGASLQLEPNFGVAVIGGDAPAGRRRFTAAHELGHHLLGDEYQSDVGVAASRDEREQLVHTFAAALLLPMRALLEIWDEGAESPRELLIKVAGEYRVSWSVAVTTAYTCGLIEGDTQRELLADTPRKGDFLALCGSEPVEDLPPGQTGPRWRRAVMHAFADGAITPARAVELLHELIDEADLPDREVLPMP